MPRRVWLWGDYQQQGADWRLSCPQDKGPPQAIGFRSHTSMPRRKRAFCFDTWPSLASSPTAELRASISWSLAASACELTTTLETLSASCARHADPSLRAVVTLLLHDACRRPELGEAHNDPSLLCRRNCAQKQERQDSFIPHPCHTMRVRLGKAISRPRL